MISLFDVSYIILSIFFILLQYLRFKKRHFKGSIGNVLCKVSKQNFGAIILFTVYNCVLLMNVNNAMKYKSLENKFFLVTIVIIEIIGILQYSRKIFISTLGIGCMALFGSIYEFIEWEKVKDWYIEKYNNKNRYTFGVRINIKEKIITWKLNQQEKEKIKEIFIKYKKDKGIEL